MEIVTKVYDHYEQACSAVSDLGAAGIPSSAISLMANKHVSDAYEDVDEASAQRGPA